jgi:hypothetical protein
MEMRTRKTEALIVRRQGSREQDSVRLLHSMGAESVRGIVSWRQKTLD